jgi:hypothetical protein
MKITFLEESVPDTTTLTYVGIEIPASAGKARGAGKDTEGGKRDTGRERDHDARGGGSFNSATRVEDSGPAKNKEKSRDPETRSAKKGNAWHFEEKRANRGGCGERDGAQRGGNDGECGRHR